MPSLLRLMASQRSVDQNISILELQSTSRKQMDHVNFSFHQLRAAKISTSLNSGPPTKRRFAKLVPVHSPSKISQVQLSRLQIQERSAPFTQFHGSFKVKASSWVLARWIIQLNSKVPMRKRSPTLLSARSLRSQVRTITALFKVRSLVTS